MPRYYCDYCDVYMKTESLFNRKQHNKGVKHQANVRDYYRQFEEQHTQSLIDERVKEHLSRQAAFGNGAPFAVWQPGVRPPIFPAPLPIPGSAPMGAPGIYMNQAHPVYDSAPLTAPGTGYLGAPMRVNALPDPPPMIAPIFAPGSNGAPSGAPQPAITSAASWNFSGTSRPTPSTFPSSVGNAPYPTPSGAVNFAYAQANSCN